MLELPAEGALLENYIDGALVPPSKGEYLDSMNPALGKPWIKIPSSSMDDVQVAVDAAQRALPGWAATSPKERAGWLHRIADAIEANLEVLAIAESQDQGKPISLARSVDIPRAVTNFRFFAGQILHMHDRAFHTHPGAVNYTSPVPVGVCGLISPWNLPLYLLTWKIAPCLASGCTAVCKPSEITSVTAYLLTKIMKEVGLPKGVCNMVYGYGHTVGNAIVTHPTVRAVSFTGGTVTAKHIIKASADEIKRLSLELGGKNPAIIFADADMDKCIATTVRSSFANQGEICLCTSRILVERKCLDDFMARYVDAASKLVVGDPADPASNMGALVSKEHLAKVESYIQLARDAGATIHTGGARPDNLPKHCREGYFLRPTVITGLTHDSRPVQEEIFGPVTVVIPFDTEQEALHMANDVKYGLAATLWTSNADRVHRMSSQIMAGYVWVNCWMLRDIRVPFGGMKASGVGREGGDYSLEFFTENRNICIKYDEDA